MTYREDSAILKWITNRIIYKFGESKDEWYVKYLLNLSGRMNDPNISISDNELDNIIAQYYVDFFLDKDDNSNFGFDDKDREILRTNIKKIYQDINNQISARPYIMKG
jgi:hypothetical protein